MLGWLGPQEWAAVLLSLKVAFWATVWALPLALLTAYALARWEFAGKQLLNGLVHLPLILPPVVTGYLLLLGFGPLGPIGSLLEAVGLGVAFRWSGAALAAGTTITYKILYNDAVAMTGGQGNDGDLTPQQILAEVKAMGVKT